MSNAGRFGLIVFDVRTNTKWGLSNAEGGVLKSEKEYSIVIPASLGLKNAVGKPG
jgi:hypothetical protein